MRLHMWAVTSLGCTVWRLGVWHVTLFRGIGLQSPVVLGAFRIDNHSPGWPPRFSSKWNTKLNAKRWQKPWYPKQWQKSWSSYWFGCYRRHFSFVCKFAQSMWSQQCTRLTGPKWEPAICVLCLDLKRISDIRRFLDIYASGKKRQHETQNNWGSEAAEQITN